MAVGNLADNDAGCATRNRFLLIRDAYPRAGPIYIVPNR